MLPRTPRIGRPMAAIGFVLIGHGRMDSSSCCQSEKDLEDAETLDGSGQRKTLELDGRCVKIRRRTLLYKLADQRENVNAGHCVNTM